MSPAAELLDNFRARRKLSQALFARLTGLQASYVSGILRGKQHIPEHPKFLEQISVGLALTESQKSKLRLAINLSPRALSVPPNADREIFLMIATLRDRIADLDSEFALQIRKQLAAYRPHA